MSTTTDKWAAPIATSKAEAVFGIRSVMEQMPTMDEIPKEFKSRDDRNLWIKLQNTWFYEGLRGYEFVPTDGINKDDALNHLKAIQRSWQPKHEHKEAAVAYLMSRWFKSITPPQP